MKQPRYFESPVMTVTECCAYLRIEKSTLYRLLKRNAVPAFRIGSEWRFNKIEILKWIEAQDARNLVGRKR